MTVVVETVLFRITCVPRDEALSTLAWACTALQLPPAASATESPSAWPAKVIGVTLPAMPIRGANVGYGMMVRKAPVTVAQAPW